MDSWKCRCGLAVLALGAALLAPAAYEPAQAQEASEELVTITAPPRAAARPAAHKPAVRKQAKAKPAAKAAVKAVRKPAVAAAKPAPAASAPAAAPAAQPDLQTSGSPYPLPPDTVPIPEEIFAASPARPAPVAPAPPALPPVRLPPAPTVAAPATPSPPLAAAPAPAAPATTGAIPPGGTLADMQPLAHARSAGATRCMDALAKASSTAIDADHEAFSTWSTSAPNAHLFQTIALMRYPNQTAPRSASVLVVTPTAADSCEGGTVQVVPSARSCAAIQAQLMQGGKAMVTLTGLPVIENLAGIRQILLPAPNNGCVMISVGLIAAPAGK